MRDRNFFHRTVSSHPSESRRPKSVLYYLTSCLTACLSFLIVSLLLQQLHPAVSPPENIDDISPKYSYYQSQKDDYDTLFFGSSRTYSHVIPRQFDALTQASGIRTNSFNFGIPGMFDVEGSAFLEGALSHPPKQLK